MVAFPVPANGAGGAQPASARYVRVTTLHNVWCWPREAGGHHIREGVFVIDGTGLQCPRCERRVYVVPHTGSEQVLTVGVTQDEIREIQRRRLPVFEALLYLEVISFPGILAR